MKPERRRFRIGEYDVDPLAGLVRRADDAEGATPRHLQPKIMSVLVCLADRQGSVVEREELIRQVWSRPATDEVLTRAIHELRVAFSDSPERPGYIQTVPKIGYRLIAPVKVTRTEARQSAHHDTAENRQHQAGESPLRSFGWASALLSVAVMTLAIGGYFFLNRDHTPQSVENDRVVLAGFENLTNKPNLGPALDIAFRTGIEQSPWLSIIAPIALSSTLERMGKDAGVPIDRPTAIEISLREQAHAVIVGSVTSVGESYRVSGEILEPQTGRTVFAHHGTAVDENAILRELDKVVAAIRQESGEALSSIEKTTLPLEKVTTANYEALEAYSIGMQKSGLGDLDVAIAFFQEAIRLDPTFAMAFAKLAFVQLNKRDDDPDADFNLEKALENQDRLTQREQLYVEGLRVRNERPDVLKQAWSLLAHTYPKYAEGYRRLGNVYFRYDNDFASAAEQLQLAVALPDPWNPVASYNLGFSQLAMGQNDKGLESFQRAWDESKHPMSAGLGIAHIAMKNYADAEAYLLANQAFPAANVRHTIESTAAIYNIDRGRFSEAMKMTQQAAATAAGDISAEQRSLLARCAILERGQNRDLFRACLSDLIAKEMALFENGYFKRRYWPVGNLALLGKIAARNSMYSDARTVYDAIKDAAATSGIYVVESYAKILSAELLLGDSKYEGAIEVLEPMILDHGLFQARESLARAYELSRDRESAVTVYRSLVGARGQAFSEHMSRRFGNEFHVLDWAVAHFHLGRLYEEIGEPESALSAYESLMAHWSGSDSDIPILAMADERVTELRKIATLPSP